MKIVLGSLSIDVNEKAIKGAKSKKAFVEKMVKNHRHLGVSEDVLANGFESVYDTLIPPKDSRK